MGDKYLLENKCAGLLLLLITLLAFVTQASAFSSYVAPLQSVYGSGAGSCGTCHVSPAGGGALTTYGSNFSEQSNFNTDPAAALRAIGAPPGITPTVTVTTTPTVTPTVTVTAIPNVTVTVTPTVPPTVTVTATPTATMTVTPTPTATPVASCGGQCHPTYNIAVGNSMHNQTKNAAAPACTTCHVGYVPGHSTGTRGFIVNETNTCRNCHIDGINGFNESHTRNTSRPADCTQCHFANTTKPFSQNASLYAHDHNLKVEHNFYEYNSSGGMPLQINGGMGAGMFPYYTCTLTCHKFNATTGRAGRIERYAPSWLESNHARSLRYPAANDNKNNCARCKSPPNYNDSLKGTNPNISAADWQGIQCRVCHNMHNVSFSKDIGGAPLAYYNSTSSSIAGYAFYEAVPDATILCEKCHTGATHDSKYAGTHKDKVGFDCASCHANTTFNNATHKFEVKNTTSGETGCEVCHKAEKHTFQFTSIHADKVTCEACHDKTVARNGNGYAVNASDEKIRNVSVVYGLYLDTATGMVSSYKDSHGTPSTWPLHNISKNVSCDKCHGTLSNATGLLAPLLNLTDTIPPTTTISGVAENGSYNNNVTVTLTAADNPGGSGINKTIFIVNGGPTSTYAVPFVVDTMGQDNVTYWSTDNAGNVEQQKMVNFTVVSGIPSQVNATREIGTKSIVPGESTNITVRITTNINQALALHEIIPEGWSVTRISDDADAFKNSTNEWVWSDQTPGAVKIVTYKLTSLLRNNSIGTYEINGTISNENGVAADVEGDQSVKIDIIEFYRRLGEDRTIIETRDLLKAFDDRRSGTAPQGFDRPLNAQEILEIINEWLRPK